MDLLFRNAKQYNEPKSKLYKDADHLQRLMLIRKKDLDRAEVVVKVWFVGMDIEIRWRFAFDTYKVLTWSVERCIFQLM